MLINGNKGNTIWEYYINSCEQMYSSTIFDRYYISLSSDFILSIWDIRTGNCVNSLSVLSARSENNKEALRNLYKIIVIKHLKCLLIPQNNYLMFINLFNGNQLFKFEIKDNSQNLIMTDICLSKDEKYLALTSSSGFAYLFHLEYLNKIFELNIDNLLEKTVVNSTHRCVISHDNKKLFIAGDYANGIISIIDIKNESLLYHFQIDKELLIEVNTMFVTDDNQNLVVCGTSGKYQSFNINRCVSENISQITKTIVKDSYLKKDINDKNGFAKNLEILPAYINSFALNENSNILFISLSEHDSIAQKNTIIRMDLNDPYNIKTNEEFSYPIIKIETTEQGNSIIAATKNTIYFLDSITLEIKSKTNIIESIYKYCLSKNNNKVIFTEQNNIKIIDLYNHHCKFSYTIENCHIVQQFILNLNETTIFIIDSKGVFFSYDLLNNKLKEIKTQIYFKVSCMCVSPDEKSLYVNSNSKIYTVSLISGNIINEIETESTIFSMTINDYGTLLLLKSDKNKISLYSIIENKFVNFFTDHVGTVQQLMFCFKDKYICTCAHAQMMEQLYFGISKQD